MPQNNSEVKTSMEVRPSGANLESLSLKITDEIKTEEELLNILKAYIPTPTQDSALLELDLSNVFKLINNEVMDFISKNFSNIQKLNLSCCEYIEDKGFRSLASLTNLQRLNLSYNKITDEGLQNLVSLPNLHSLNLTDCESITNAGLTSLPNLRSLDISYCYKITDEWITSLRNLPLNYLSLVGCLGVKYQKIFHSRTELIAGGICVPETYEQKKQNAFDSSKTRSSSVTIHQVTNSFEKQKINNNTSTIPINSPAQEQKLGETPSRSPEYCNHDKLDKSSNICKIL